MIKFFRKIRQQLLTENKLSKYLFYAIGEIVLVVMGILIAVSVNNWNETQKDKTIEQKVLNTLNSDFTSNITQLQGNIDETEEMVGNIKKLFQLFRKTQTELSLLPKDSIRTGIGGYATFNPSDGALTSLLLSGGLNIITNDSLKNKLTNWPNIVNDAKEDEDILVEKITKDLAKQKLKYQSYINNPKFKLNKLEMFDDLIIQNTLVEIRRGAGYQIYLYKELQNEIEEILNLIDKEIWKRKKMT